MLLWRKVGVPVLGVASRCRKYYTGWLGRVEEDSEDRREWMGQLYKQICYNGG